MLLYRGFWAETMMRLNRQMSVPYVCQPQVPVPSVLPRRKSERLKPPNLEFWAGFTERIMGDILDRFRPKRTAGISMFRAVSGDWLKALEGPVVVTSQSADNPLVVLVPYRQFLEMQRII